MERADWIGAPDGLTRVDGTGVTAPSGFRAAGVPAGLKGGGLLDLGLLVSDRPAASALVDTPSALPSAAVIYSRTLHAGSLRGVVVNSGCANAATGEQGIVDARAMGETAAAAAGVPVGSLAVCSTGVIGERLPMKALTAGVDAAALIRRSVKSLSGRATFGEITDATLATLRAECPGWDYQTLHADFRTWIEADAGRTPVSYQNAFIGYVRRFDAKNRHTLR